MAYLLGSIAVAAFALTLPATRVAVQALDPVFVGGGRVVAAALLGTLYLLLVRRPLPSRQQMKRLLVVSAGTAVGFPLLTAWAMRSVDASHGGVVLGVLPLVTAMFAAGERLSRGFWACAVLGAAIVVGYSLARAGGAPGWADLALLGAILCAGFGYAEGARLSRSLGGLRVISWSVIIAAPVLVLPVLAFAPQAPAPLESWAGFFYVAAISQFLGFIPWFRGLALGGVARVSQTQLLQPFLTVLASGWLLGEPGSAATWAVAATVVIVVALGSAARSASSAGTAAPAPRAATARPD